MTACPICGSAEVFRRFANPAAPVAVQPESFGSSRRNAESIGVTACRACGAGWQDPPPAPESVAEAYREMRDELYLAEEKTRRRSLGRSLALLARWSDGRQGHLLDVGCSAGLFGELARGAGWDVLGIEPSQWLAERARERLGGAVVCARFEDVALAPGSFDAVCLWDVLEHVSDPDAFLAKAAQSLRPGGVLALNVPNLQSWIARALGRRWPLLLPEHLFFFSPASLRLLLGRHGIASPKLLLHPVSFGAGFIAHRLAQHAVPGARWVEKALNTVGLGQIPLPLLMGELTAIGRKAS